MYEYEINMTPEEEDKNGMDVWGAAELWLDGGNKGVEYNWCWDDGENYSAIYKMEMHYDNPKYPNGYLGTDCDTYVHYEVDCNNENWKKELIDVMHMVAVEFHSGHEIDDDWMNLVINSRNKRFKEV